MISEKDGWVKIASSIDTIPFSTTGIAEIELHERVICVAKYKDQLVAFPATCPHAGARFADGFVDVLGNVVCPLHRYKFCLKNGYNISGEGYHLKRWPVAVRSDGVFVQMHCV